MKEYEILYETKDGLQYTTKVRAENKAEAAAIFETACRFSGENKIVEIY